ncbi:MAG: hypothetical protein AAGA85_21780 [Bacteroidota bacterium]
MKSFFLILVLVACHLTNAQTPEPRHETIGFELDALPYIVGGFYGSIWYGRNQMRYRAVITKITTPEFVLDDGFTNNDMYVYALITEYFFKPGFDGWWVGTGLEYWDAEIQTDAELETAEYENYIFTVGSGYAWKFYKNFYLNPWAAVHLRIAGDSQVPVDELIFEPALLLPEVSVKLGWHF